MTDDEWFCHVCDALIGFRIATGTDCPSPVLVVGDFEDRCPAHGRSYWIHS